MTITAHDFSKPLDGSASVCFAGTLENVLSGIDKLRAGLVDGSILWQGIKTTQNGPIDDFVMTEIVITVAETVSK